MASGNIARRLSRSGPPFPRGGEFGVACVPDGSFASGQLTCTQLTKLYLDRIDAYDRRGPSLHAIITVNPKASEMAAEMDQEYSARPRKVGPLHCIQLVLGLDHHHQIDSRR